MNKSIFWLIIIGVIGGLITLTSHILVPFFAAFIIAYILRPLINAVTVKCKISRDIVPYLVFSLFIGVFIIVCTILFPAIYKQTAILISKIPLYKDYIQRELLPILMHKFHAIDPDIANNIKNSIDSFLNIIFSVISRIFNNIWSYTLATIYGFMLVIVVPILLFYFLRDWSKMVSYVEGLLPVTHKQQILTIFSDINKLLSAYMRGQMNICLMLACYYSILLALIGLDLSLLLGVLSGFLIIIPFIGGFLSFTLAIIISYFTFGLSNKLLYVFVIYIIGYSVESYILSPTIIGERIGLHPLWVMLAVFACGSLFGFWGVFFAIPIAGIIKILISVVVDCYKSSRFYS